MDIGPSRRRLLAALGAVTVPLAGCMDVLSDDDPGTEGGSADPRPEGGGDTQPNDESSETELTDSDVKWPAIDYGEVISDFESFEHFESLIGEFDAAPDEARTGSQAMVIENDGDRAAVSILFPDGLDLQGWDASMAVKAESLQRIGMEFHAPRFGDHLAIIRVLPNGYDDWIRVDFGYTDKSGGPDLTNITEIRIIGFGPENGPTRFVVDDLRRTEAVDNGKAILVLWDGLDSHYDIAAPMLEERGWKAAVPVTPRRIGDRGRIGSDKLRELQDRGWDICPAPQGSNGLSGLSEEDQREIIEATRAYFVDRGFTDGSRHFFAPNWRQMDPITHAIVRDIHETGFVFGSCTSGVPPTGIHTIPMIWGPALHEGVRRHINLADQYQLLTVLRIPRIVEDGGEVDANSMSVGDFQHLLDHLAHRGLDVITPSDLIAGAFDGGRGQAEEERPDGVILEAGESYSFDGSGSETTEEFRLSDGILIGRFSHQGRSDIIIHVTPINGDLHNELLVSTTGSSSGKSIMTVNQGTYRLDIEANGDWTVGLDQPEVHSNDLMDLPIRESGRGSAFIGPIWTERDVGLVATHDGSGAFIVDGYGADGSREQIINQTGEFDGSRSYRAGGTTWLNIEADGAWTLEVSQRI